MIMGHPPPFFFFLFFFLNEFLHKNNGIIFMGGLCFLVLLSRIVDLSSTENKLPKR